jgi:hypothetical protein
VSESTTVAPLLDKLKGLGFVPETCAMDKGYDLGPIYDVCEDRDVRPVISMRETTRVKRGEHKPPTCEHGEWRFAGADYDRKATKWRCPTGECQPASAWIKADRLHTAHPAFHAALEGPPLWPRIRRASVWQAQERMGASSALTGPIPPTLFRIVRVAWGRISREVRYRPPIRPLDPAWIKGWRSFASPS